MKENNLIKKGVVVAVILLFIGLAFAPSINANISKDSELVEITTEVSGIDGVEPYTVKLTTEEANEVDRLFDNILVRLNESKSREETVEIFNEAVVELDKYGLLGDLNIEQAQRLVTSGYQYPIDNEVFNRIHERIIMMLDENENALCLIAGKTAETRIVGPMTFVSIGLAGLRVLSIILMLEYFWYPLWNKFPLLYYITEPFLFLFDVLSIPPFILSAIISFLSPVKFLSGIGYGAVFFSHGYMNYLPAHGRIYTIGLNGIKYWDKPFYGQYLIDPLLTGNRYAGAIGFTGINIISEIRTCSYLGTALSVKIGPNPP